MDNIFDELGVRPVLNAQGNRTLLGGGTPSDTVKTLMDSIEDYYVNMGDLMDSVGSRISEMLGVEGALVTSGCAAALAYAAAACMTGDDVDRIEQIPDTTGMPNEIIIQRQLRIKYDRTMSIPGGKLIEIGDEDQTTVEQLEEAIGPNTAAIHYLAPGDRNPGALPLEQVIDIVDADLLEAMARAVPATKGNVRRLATLGKMVPNLEGRVVDKEGQVLTPRGVGIIEVRGKAVTPGYITVDGPVETQDADGWLDTGDIGYFTEEGLVVVCGRIKDVIIMGGRNIYPTDIERAAASVAGVRPGNAVAIRLDAGDKRESFAVAVETNDFQDPEEVKRIERDVVHAVHSEVGVRPRTVAVLGPGSIPKTSSGKLRRATSAALLG